MDRGQYERDVLNHNEDVECIDIVKKYYSEEKETAKYLKGEGALKQN